MYCIREISQNIFWVGGNDRRLERFENLFPIPYGVSYNSYLILDEKTALMDTVDFAVSEQFLENVDHALAGRKLDYLVVNHIEPDHCACIAEIVRRYPDLRLVGNAKTFQLLEQFYGLDVAKNRQQVNEGEEIPLGEHVLRFYAAPMVHWPEVMMTLETQKHILFSADAFGSFRALSGNLFADETDFESAFLDEARRYYANIVGRYGAQVQAVLAKFKELEIAIICPLHGPIWRKDLGCLLDKYDKWSRYAPEKSGVLLCYASMYGHTENAMSVLANKLAERNVHDMRMYDVSKTHPSYIIADAFKYSHLVFGSPTYNMNLYFTMDSLLREMAALGLKNRKVALIGNHSWASAALKEMKAILEKMQGMELLLPAPDLRTRLRMENEGEMDSLADAIASSL